MLKLDNETAISILNKARWTFVTLSAVWVLSTLAVIELTEYNRFRDVAPFTMLLVGFGVLLSYYRHSSMYSDNVAQAEAFRFHEATENHERLTEIEQKYKTLQPKFNSLETEHYKALTELNNVKKELNTALTELNKVRTDSQQTINSLKGKLSAQKRNVTPTIANAVENGEKT